MTTPNPELTSQLAFALGAYMLAAGAGGLLKTERLPKIIDEFQTRPALTFVTGVLVFALGVTLILVHNDYSTVLASFISLVAWVAALEGLVLLAAPDWLLKTAARFLEPKWLNAFMMVTVALGAVLAGAALL